MSKRQVQLVIVCEDSQQEVFARQFFMRQGINRHKIRVKKNPKGKGSGEQFVRQQYPQEVKALRNKSNFLSIVLAIVIDADTYSVAQRFDQMDQGLSNNGLSERHPDEAIAIFIPKRNIETWIHYLNGRSVNEEESYSKFNRASDCIPSIQKLVTEICPVGIPADAPASLHTACDELQRIFLT